MFCERIFGPIKSGICACGKYQGIGVREQKKISLHSPLWLQWGTNLRVITSRNCEKTIEVQYDPLGTSSQIYEHYQLGRNKEDFFFGIYVCTTVGCVIFIQQIEEAMQGTLKVLRHRD